MIRPGDRHNWFGKTFKEFSARMLPWAGLPICYVEIGVWKGDSAAWVCENILTHPQAIGIGIDPYEPDYKRDAAATDRIWCDVVQRMQPWSPRFTLYREKSQDWLRGPVGRAIDVLYLDGSHLAHDVVLDFAYAFPHLHVGSLVIFDDYRVSLQKADGIPRVDVAIQAIETGFAGFVQREGEFRRQAALRIVKQPVLGELP